MCYLTLLPLLLWPMSGWASPPLAVVIAFLLLGVENIGAFIEEPFHVSVHGLDEFHECATRGVFTL
jgi:predicted membrane chloride channel (bestrophin family)